MCACSYETRLLLPQVESRRRRCVARVSEREDLRTMANTDRVKDDLYDNMKCILDTYLDTFDKTAALKCHDGLDAIFKHTEPAEMKDVFRRQNRTDNNVFIQALTRFKFKAFAEIETKIIQLFLDNLPGEVLSTPRSTGEYCGGQNALHCVIGRNQIKLLKAILDCNNLKAQRKGMLSQNPNQIKLQGTVMMGELPLSVAALTFNKDMVTMLLGKGAKLEGQNSRGDTVVHSLIRYAAIYPAKTKQVLQMFEFIKCEIEKASHTTRAPVWLLVNNDDKLNPLQLATKLGQQELFSYIIDLEHYKFIDLEEGIFDIFSYDISEIDTVPPRIESSKAKLEQDIKVPQDNRTQSVQVLHILMKLNSVVAERFVSIKPISNIIRLKWKQSKEWFVVWAIFHFAFMVVLTYYTFERAEVKPPSNSPIEFVNRLYENNPFVSVYGTLSFIVGCFYVVWVITIVSYCWYTRLWCRNIIFYLVEIFIFAIALVVDYIWAVSKQNLEFNYSLVIAVILGWLLLLFFMRPFMHLSFFTTLLENVFFDLLQFSVIMIPILIAFTAAMYFAMQGSSDDTFLCFFKTLFFMLQVMVGLGDFDGLFTARHPVFVFIVFVTFVLMTTILLLNALIALMSNTCNDVFGGGIQKRKSMCRIQKLYTVLFIEHMFLGTLKLSVGNKFEKKRRYCPDLKVIKMMPRCLLEVFKIDNDAKSAYFDPDTTNSRERKRGRNKKLPNKFHMNTVDVTNLSRTLSRFKTSVERTTVDQATDRD